MYNGIFVDDRDAEYAELLSKDGLIEFTFQGLEDIMALRKSIVDASPSIVALDYRLDENLGDLPASKAFKGGPLAQLLRDAAIEAPAGDFPIVLVSSEQNIRQRFDPDKTAHDLFDDVMIKEEIQASSETAINSMLALCAAYEKLRGLDCDYDLLTLVDLPEDQSHIVDHQELVTLIEGAKAPHIVCRIFAKSLVGRNGLLVDGFEVCARFGVSKASLEQVVEILIEQGLKEYSGLLGSQNQRWWSHQIDQFLLGVFGGRPTGIPASERVRILGEKFGRPFEVAMSPWVQGERAANELIAFACACCGRGTELKHSLAVYDPPAASFISRRRLCWDCIQTDNYKSGQCSFDIQKGDQALIPKILAARQ